MTEKKHKTTWDEWEENRANGIEMIPLPDSIPADLELEIKLYGEDSPGVKRLKERQEAIRRLNSKANSDNSDE